MKKFNGWLCFAAIILATSWTYFLPLLLKADFRAPVVFFFVNKLLPLLLFHIAVLLFLNLLLKAKAKASFLFWGLSLVALLAAGGALRLSAFLAVTLLALTFTILGRVVATKILPEEAQGWGPSLGIGILIVSILSSFLASFHLFKGWVLGPVLLLFLLLIFAFRLQPLSLATFRAGWKNLSQSWTLATALALEGAFLLASFIYVTAVAPEMTYDGIRFYVAYINLLKANSGFFSIPEQWYYIVPRAGLSYAGTLMILGGQMAARWSMFLAWLALIGIACRGQVNALGSNLALVLVMSSCPIYIWFTSSLMQDTFVCLVVVGLALICIEGKDPGSNGFWAAVGGSMGLAWSTKYSILAYAAPLGIIALVRAAKQSRLKQMLIGMSVALASALLVAVPWLYNTFRSSGNPFFPYLGKYFSSPLWPNASPDILGDFTKYQLPGGSWQFLRWPIDFTYGGDFGVYFGGLGLCLVVLLVFAIPALQNSSSATKAFAISGILGTLLIWRVTAYIRYWIPGLWLFTMALVPGMERIARTRREQVGVCLVALLLTISHLPFRMMIAWHEPKGFPWDLYTGKITEAAYVSREYPAFSKIHKLQEFREDLPRVWFTGYEATGLLPVVPLEASIWEFRMHGVEDTRSIINYLGSVGAKYWIINHNWIETRWFKDTFIPKIYWSEQQLVASHGPIAIYRMKTASEALSEFDKRSFPGTDLLFNTGFEKGTAKALAEWRTMGTPQWKFGVKDAHSGEGYIQVNFKSFFWQRTSVPVGVKNLELTQWVKATQPGIPVLVRLHLSWEDQKWRPLSSQIEVVPAEDSWTEYRMKAAVPSGAAYAVVYLCSHICCNDLDFDEVHLYSR